VPTLHQALNDSEVNSTYSMFPKKEYIQGEEMKNEREIKIKALIYPALLFRLSDLLACILRDNFTRPTQENVLYVICMCYFKITR